MTRDDLERRREWASRHAARLSLLLDAPRMSTVQQRVFRARYWHGDEFIGASIVQRFNNEGEANSLSVLMVRGYDQTPSNPEMHLTGKYTPYAVVIFLRLDTMDPDELDWKDETSYLVVPSTVNGLVEKYR